MTLTSNLIIKVDKEKHKIIEDPEKARELQRKIEQFVANNKDKGIIIAKSMPGTPTAVATNFKTKEGNVFQFPEPNPIHLYFQNACNRFKSGTDILKELTSIDSIDTSSQFNKFSEYFFEVTTGIIFLVTTVEAYINQKIPEDINFKLDDSELNKKDIEWKDIKTKIKNILPKIHNKEFHKVNEKEYSQILELQNIRDNLIHLKTDYKENKTYYENIIKTLLDFNPVKYVDAVILFLNFFHPNFIEEL